MTVERVDMFNGWLPAMRGDEWFRHCSHPEEWSSDEIADHMRTMALGLVDEALELVREFHWKPWKQSDHPGLPPSPEGVAAEASDLLHFLAHLLNLAGVTEDQLNQAMYEARLKNRRRLTEGYSYQ